MHIKYESNSLFFTLNTTNNLILVVSGAYGVLIPENVKDMVVEEIVELGVNIIKF
jgi:hypothetical protein